MEEQTDKFGGCDSELRVLVVETIEETGEFLRVETGVDGVLMTVVLDENAECVGCYCVRLCMSCMNLEMLSCLLLCISISIIINNNC